MKNIEAQRKLCCSYEKCVVSKQKALVFQILEGLNLATMINKKDTSVVNSKIKWPIIFIINIYCIYIQGIFQTIAFVVFPYKHGGMV